jgi:hypothetical protein
MVKRRDSGPRKRQARSVCKLLLLSSCGPNEGNSVLTYAELCKDADVGRTNRSSRINERKSLNWRWKRSGYFLEGSGQDLWGLYLNLDYRAGSSKKIWGQFRKRLTRARWPRQLN